MGAVDSTGDDGEDVNVAERVRLSFRSPDSDPDAGEWWIADSEWLQESMTEETYLTYLRRAHAGPVSVGEEWEEVVNCGCASPEDVLLRVDRVEGGTAIGPETTIEVVSRKVVLENEDGDPEAED